MWVHPNTKAIARSYQRGRFGCLVLIFLWMLGAIIALAIYAFNRPTVRVIEVVVPVYEYRYVEPPPRKNPPTKGRKMD